VGISLKSLIIEVDMIGNPDSENSNRREDAAGQVKE
jgi:hypothetical protein